MPKKYKVQLSKDQVEIGQKLTSSGTTKVRVYKRARVLLLSDEGRKGGAKTDTQIAEMVEVSLATVERVRRQFVEAGFQAALVEKPRSGAPKKFSGQTRAKITALACSDPPEGRGAWTLQLLADQLVVLGQVDSVSRETVRQALKRRTSKS